MAHRKMLSHIQKPDCVDCCYCCHHRRRCRRQKTPMWQFWFYMAKRARAYFASVVRVCGDADVMGWRCLEFISCFFEVAGGITPHTHTHLLSLVMTHLLSGSLFPSAIHYYFVYHTNRALHTRSFTHSLSLTLTRTHKTCTRYEKRTFSHTQLRQSSHHHHKKYKHKKKAERKM